MAGITSAMCTTFKQELLEGAHCFNATVNPTFTIASAASACTSVSSTAGVSVGMAFSCSTAGIPAGTVVATITASNAMTLSNKSTAAISGGAGTATGDLFYMALIKGTPGGTYDKTTPTYVTVTTNTDEVPNGAGYTTAGQLLVNATAVTDVSGVAWVDFTTDPSWTTATFTTAGCMIYNSSIRTGHATLSGAGRACSVHDFGGNQVVSGGTFTVIIPVPAVSTGILRLG